MCMKQLDKLWYDGRKFLGVKYSIMCGAMTWISDHNLVSAISNAGGFGILACGSMSPDLLEKEIKKTFSLTNKPFGVNLIAMHPKIEDLLDVCIDQKISHIILVGAMINSNFVRKLKKSSIKIICFAPTLSFAKRLVKLGVDAIILEGMEAGGHIGPVSLSVLMQEIALKFSEVPIFVAGGIGSGDIMLSYLEMGASGCQIGTRFACAKESNAHPNFKKAFIKANARDAQVSVQIDPRFPVIPVRTIKNEATELFMKLQMDVIKQFNEDKITYQDAIYKIEHFWAGSLRDAVVNGDVKKGSLMAGQSVGMVSEEKTVMEIIDELINQALFAIREKKKKYEIV